MSENLITSLLVGLFLTYGFFLQETGALSEVQKNGFKWTDCGGDEVGATDLYGSFTDYCESGSCNLRINHGYSASFTLFPGNAHKNSTLRVTAGNNDLIEPIYKAMKPDGTPYIYAFTLVFDSRFDSNKASEPHEVTARVVGETGDFTELCRKFTINLNSLDLNDQQKYGGNCTINQSPCAFANSICKSNSCQCDSAAVLNNGSECKKKVGKSCLSDNDCLNYGECDRDGECRCKRGYEPNGRNDVCNTSTAITFSVLILALQQAFVLFRNL
jgi:hypothetical protein